MRPITGGVRAKEKEAYRRLFTYLPAGVSPRGNLDRLRNPFMLVYAALIGARSATGLVR